MLAFRCGQVRAVDQPFDDARIDIFSKRFSDALVVAQLHDHAVEPTGQLSNLIFGRYIDGLIEIARLDRPRTFQQPSDRANDTAADKIGENQSDNRS